jgi:LmeA-like phospholipid-binding
VRREYPKVRGPGRTILLVLVVLGVIAVGVDAGARAVAEARLASSVQNALNLPDRPDIELQGFPFLLQVARGRLEALEVELDDVDAEGLNLDRVTLSFEELTFDRVILLRGTGTVSVSSGSAQAVVTEDDLSAYLQEEGTPVLVKLDGPGIRVSTRINTGGETTSATAAGAVRVEDGRLVFSPDEVEVEGTIGVPAAALAFDVTLPDLVPGIRYESVLVNDGIAAIEANLEETELRLGG